MFNPVTGENYTFKYYKSRKSGGKNQSSEFLFNFYLIYFNWLKEKEQQSKFKQKKIKAVRVEIDLC